ncbi:MAG: TRAP transporter fused permease subunit [Methanosarcinaceae archaeon]|nr:TRAP transporter fused permease subunit [Methanosarcinaceae archaeon]
MNEINSDELALKREPTGINKSFLSFIAAFFVLFHIYTSFAGPLPNLRQRAVHVGFALTLVFCMMKPFIMKKNGIKNSFWLTMDMILVSFTVMMCGFIIINYNWIMDHPAESSLLSLVLGSIGILLVLEAGRRTLGIFFPALTLLFILYALLGNYIPDIPIIGKHLAYWGHRGFSIRHVIEVMYLSDQGLWGFVTGISATLVAIFIIFGGFLLSTGAGEHFIDTAVWITGRFYGGGAKVAVVASTLFGALSGSAVANVATTGTFTIPLMKRLNYSENFAAGVEAAASTGGQLVPPIMGSAAFLMAEILEVAYIKVAICALIPACLYYLSVFSAIHFESRNRGLERIPRESIKTFREIIKPSKSLPLFIPIIILIVLMLSGRTAESSAFWAIFVFAFLFTFSTFKWDGIKKRFVKFYSGMSSTGLSLAKVVPLLICANIIVSLVSLTGIGVTAAESIISLGGKSVTLALLLSALVTIILGMGVPTPAAYLLGAAVLAPSLISLGLHPIASHMFIFYYAVISAITPPVCAAVYVAAGIADSNWLKSAGVSIKLTLVAFVIPFIFISNTSLLTLGTNSQIAWSLVSISIATIMISGVLMGYFFWGRLGIPSRIALLLASVLCFMASPIYVFTGMGIGVFICLYHKYRKNVLPSKLRGKFVLKDR